MISRVLNVSRLRTRSLFAIATLFAGSLVVGLAWTTAGRAGAEPEGWISLFNGKNLDGWTVKITGYDANENYGDTFRVEDGILKVSYDKYPKFDGKFGHLFSKAKYSNYRLRIEYRFVG